MGKDKPSKVKKDAHYNTVKKDESKSGGSQSAKIDTVKATNRTNVKPALENTNKSESEDSLLKQVEEEFEARKLQDTKSTADSKGKQSQATSTSQSKPKKRKKSSSTAQPKAKQDQVTAFIPESKAQRGELKANIDKATAPTGQSKVKGQHTASPGQLETNESKPTMLTVQSQAKPVQATTTTPLLRANQSELTAKANQSKSTAASTDFKVNGGQASMTFAQLVQPNTSSAQTLSTELKATTSQGSMPVAVNVDSKEKKLGGFIFMCNNATKADCFKFGVFGLPLARRDIVQQIQPGMKLFLYDINARLLHGVYIASSAGGINLEPLAFKEVDKRGYPAQVRFIALEECTPIPENIFRDAIKDNYFGGTKFNLELTVKQAADLSQLFKPVKRGAGASLAGIGTPLTAGGTSLIGFGTAGGFPTSLSGIGTSLAGSGTSLTACGTSLIGFGTAGLPTSLAGIGKPLAGSGTSLTAGGTSLIGLGAAGGIPISLAGTGTSLTTGAGTSLFGFGTAGGLGNLPAYNMDLSLYGRELETRVLSQANVPGHVQPLYSSDLLQFERERSKLEQSKALIKESVPAPIPDYDIDALIYKYTRGAFPSSSGRNILPDAMGYLHQFVRPPAQVPEMPHTLRSLDAGVDTLYRQRHDVYIDPLRSATPLFDAQRRLIAETGQKRRVSELFGIEHSLAKRPNLQDDPRFR